MVFLRAGLMAELDARRSILLGHSAVVIQSQTRCRVTRKHYITLLQVSVCIQSCCRGILARQYYKIKKREAAAVKIQKNSRTLIMRKGYSNVKAAAIVLQAWLRARAAVRAMVALSEIRYRKHAMGAVSIQTCWRSHRDFSYYKKLRKASVFSQSRWRGITARREFRILKMIANEDEMGQEMTESQHSPPAVQYIVDETNELHDKESDTTTRVVEMDAEECDTTPRAVEMDGEECDTTTRATEMDGEEYDTTHTAIEPHPTTNKITSSLQEAEKIENLTAEVEKLKALLQAEKQRADDSERKCAEAWVSSEKRLKKLEETERRVYQLQDSLNRLLYCMSEQFSQLKMILRASSTSTSTSTIPIVKDDTFDTTSDNSDASSADSDFTFPAPSPDSSNFSSFKPNALQLIVQDISATEIAGCEKWENDKAFDDYF